ncbi:MAG: hypothetical protein WHV67_03150 [Thermoanaerobaculia bacterium]
MKYIMCLFLIVFSVSLLAQAPEKEKKETLTDQEIEEIIKTEMESAGGKSYFYDPKGRRDPFKSLLVGKREGAEECVEGTLCIFWDDISLNGIWKVKGSYVAQILSKQNDLFLLKEGDLLSDGQVTKITLDCVFFRQKVNDPTKINPYQDVEKCLESPTSK